LNLDTFRRSVDAWLDEHADELAPSYRGAGTLDELFEALTLIQTGKIKNFPIVIMGKDYWQGLIDFIDKMAKIGMIAETDLNLIYATDSIDDAIAHIREKTIAPFGLKVVKRMPRHWPWLGERAVR